jgi:hypothetical protein
MVWTALGGVELELELLAAAVGMASAEGAMAANAAMYYALV